MVQPFDVQPIEIVRGTTNPFEITVTDSGGGAYNLGSNEKVVFGVKARPTDEALLIVKTAEIQGAGLFKFVLDPEDTEALPFGRYCYDVSLDKGTAFINIIPSSPFTILQNVTFRGCAD